MLAGIGATERNLKGEAVDNIKFLPECNLSRAKFTREAPSRSFWMRKQQSLKLKVLRLVLTIAGKICSFLELSFEHPYMKQFFLRE
jgi:hypothetical protein